MQKTIVTVLVTAVVLFFAVRYTPLHTAITIPSSPNPGLDCRGKDCKVDISFDCIATNVPFTCTPIPPAQVLLVSSRYKIDFTLKTDNGYTFNQTDGVAFTSANASGLFPCMPDRNDKQKYHCADNAPAATPEKADAYKYQIHVDSMGIVDPWAVNY